VAIHLPKRRSAGVDAVRVTLWATTEQAGAFGGAIQEVASCSVEAVRLRGCEV